MPYVRDRCTAILHPRTGRVPFIRPSLGEVKGDPERIADVAAWNVWILFLNGAARIDQLAFRSENVRHQEFENRSVLMTFFDV